MQMKHPFDYSVAGFVAAIFYPKPVESRLAVSTVPGAAEADRPYARRVHRHHPLQLSGIFGKTGPARQAELASQAGLPTASFAFRR